MNKKLIIINGTTGVGKSATCKELYKKLEGSVWLDGDWCWMMNPFIVNQENKKMIEENITYLLRNYLTNSSFKYVIFNWVIHSEEIFNTLLERLNDLEFNIIKITLICSDKSLKSRIMKDIKNDLRNEKSIDKSLGRLQLYKNMDTIKIDTSNISIPETVDKIIEII
ncbi:MAG: AAA family ATPase [Maledivibacter sp.]|jgi:cytidylate kinase|nr:AAA family ATPase [Maledivibacter sp.]